MLAMEGGTGVYYQAMPAVGPDGKNVMKLIPVQKVNGQFFQTQFNTERDALEVQLKGIPKPVYPSAVPSSQIQTGLPCLQPIADGRYVLKAPTEVGTLLNSIKVQTNDLSKQTCNQMHVPLAPQMVPQYAVQLPPQTNGQAMTVVQKLPVTVKSPVLPNGHFLQIPPNAKVRTLPATALPQSIKSRIMHNVGNTPNHKEGPPTVLFVSPVNSVKLNSNQPVLSLPKPSQIQKNLTQNPPANLKTSPPVCSPSSPQTSKMNTPIKWVVQERVGASARCLVPVSSSNANSEIKSVKHAESVTATKEIEASKPTPAPISQEKITSGKDNALVMCNGKVYFVAKKNSEIAKDVMVSEGGKKGINSVSPALPSSSALGLNSAKETKEQDSKKNVDSSTPSEIIDLCDDEEEISTRLGGSPGNLPTPSQTEVEESDEDSNVIFVSYIPPKSETHASEKEAKSDTQNKREETSLTEKELDTKSVSQCESEETANAEIESDTNSAFQSEREETAHGEMESVTKSASPSESKETVHAETKIDGGQDNSADKEGDDKMDVDDQSKQTALAEGNLGSPTDNMDIEEDETSANTSTTVLAQTRCQDDAVFSETVSSRDAVLGQLHNVSAQATNITEKSFESPSPVKGIKLKNDCQLRQEFGVINDVRICLQRVKPPEKPDPQAERNIVNKRTLDGIRRIIQESQLQSKIQKIMKVKVQAPHTKTKADEHLQEVKRKKMEPKEKDADQDNSSIGTINILSVSKLKEKQTQNASVFPMENSLVSQTCQEVCSSRQNAGEIAASTADNINIQSDFSADCISNTNCATPSSDQNVTETVSHTSPPSSAYRKTPVRLKKGKQCTACPCGTMLGPADTSSLKPEESPNLPIDVASHKETRKSCLHNTPVESSRPSTCQQVGHHNSVKKTRKKRSCSPRKGKALSKHSISETSQSISSLNSLENITTSLNTSCSSSAEDRSNEIVLSSNGTECDTTLRNHTQNETSNQIYMTSDETSSPSTSEKQRGPKVDEMSTQELYSMEVLDAEEIKRRERIKRLKDLLREKEAALERMRQNMDI